MTTKICAGYIPLDRKGAVTKVFVDEAAGALHVRFYEGEYAAAAAFRAALAGGSLAWSIGHAPMALDGIDEAAQTKVTHEPAPLADLSPFLVEMKLMLSNLDRWLEAAG